MNSNQSNRKRFFANLISIDAWHSEFTDEHPTADLHADLVFMTARLGGEEESKVRFRLSLKRAELIVIIPESEPVAVDKLSVSRDGDPETLKHRTTTETKSEAKIAGEIGLNISPNAGSSSLSIDAGGSKQKTETENFECDSTINKIKVVQSKTANGSYRWTVESRDGRALDGRPWPANKHRLKIIDKRKNKISDIPPTVHIEIRCAREDLIIENIEIKEKNMIQNMIPAKKNNLAAAEAYIRDYLARAGLEVGRIDDKFSELTLANIIPESN
jgi:hypothetical protein